MTPTTSSARSETLSARNLVPGTAAAARRITSAPPLVPAGTDAPGRCTSRSTTSGAASVTAATADSTSCASPTTTMLSSRSALRPDRKIEWSSTTTTRTGSATIHVLGGEAQPYLGADAARSGAHRRRAARAAHPPDDRLAHAEPVARHVGKGEARPAVAYEDLDRVGARFDVHRDLATRVPGRVQHRLPRGGGDLAA